MFSPQSTFLWVLCPEDGRPRLLSEPPASQEGLLFVQSKNRAFSLADRKMIIGVAWGGMLAAHQLGHNLLALLGGGAFPDFQGFHLGAIHASGEQGGTFERGAG